MKQILAAIAAAIRSMTRSARIVCRKTGRLILQILPDFGGGGGAAQAIPSDQAEPSADQAASSPGAVEAVRGLARKMAAGTVTMQDMHAVHADTVRWLTSLDRVQLCRLVCAADLGGYMSRRSEIRRLPRYLEQVPRPPDRRTEDREQDHEYRSGLVSTM